jgi:hypothetical protein
VSAPTCLGEVRGDPQLLPMVFVQHPGQEQQGRRVQGDDVESSVAGESVDEVDVAGLGVMGDHDLDTVVAVFGRLGEGLLDGHG